MEYVESIVTIPVCPPETAAVSRAALAGNRVVEDAGNNAFCSVVHVPLRKELVVTAGTKFGVIHIIL